MTALRIVLGVLTLVASVVALSCLWSWEEETGRLTPGWMRRWRR